MSQPFLYSVERQFPFEVDQLWSAWTDSAALEDWYHPTDLACVKGETRSELTIGGLWACGIDIASHNFAVYFYGKYTKIEKNHLLEHTMHYTESREEFDAKDMSTPSHRVTIEFEIRGEDTWVKFSQFGELPEGHAERAQAGMESYLDSLSHFLTK